jgi:nucleotide-binding universal stress UspA family protein
LYSKILVPIDGSENSMRALEHGSALSSELKSKLSVLYVMQIPPFVYVQSQQVVNSVMESLRKEAMSVLESGKNLSKKFGVEPETVFLEGGDIASVIVDYGEKNNFDAIVIGSRGNGKVKTVLLGSVSHNVLHHSKIPVTIIK